jgi:type I restriction enzyme R subunit
MLLTGFDSKYLNTLYVDKNLKQHGLIQAFSRTNRILNDTKPYGNILDYRGQEKEVNEAIALFSGKKDKERAREIWLVDPAPVVLDKLDKAVTKLKEFMESQGVECKPEQVANLKGDAARIEFINNFKNVQRLKTQLDQYTDIKEEQVEKIEELLPEDTLRAFRGAYLETAQQLKTQQGKDIENKDPALEQLDLELILFSSAIIDYDYIMSLISKYTQPSVPKKEKMSPEQLIGLLKSSSNMMDERDDISAYIGTLDREKGLNEKEVKEGYKKFKDEKAAQELTLLANKYSLQPLSLKNFVDNIIDRMIFDGEKLTDLLEPLNLDWIERTTKELELMNDLVPLLKKLVGGRMIVGLKGNE